MNSLFPATDVTAMPINRLVCAGCGRSPIRACGCGMDYVHSHVRAQQALLDNPGKSMRQIAEELHVGVATVHRARRILEAKAGVSGETRLPDYVMGRDGHRYPATHVQRKGKDAAPKLFKPRRMARHKKPVTEKDQLIAFTRELSQFAMQFSLELTQWLDTNPVLEPEGRDALAHNLESYSMQLQRLAQRVDGR